MDEETTTSLPTFDDLFQKCCAGGGEGLREMLLELAERRQDDEEETVVSVVNESSEGGFNHLHQAALYGNADCIRELLGDAGKAAGFNQVNAITLAEETALHIAAVCGYSPCIIELLRKTGADRFYPLDAYNDEGETALHVCVMSEVVSGKRKMDAVRALIQPGDFLPPLEEVTEEEKQIYRFLRGVDVNKGRGKPK